MQTREVSKSLFVPKKNKHQIIILGWYSFVRGLCNEPNDISSRLVICLFSWRFWGTFCGEHKNHPTGNKCWQTFSGIWCCRVIKGICMVIKFFRNWVFWNPKSRQYDRDARFLQRCFRFLGGFLANQPFQADLVQGQKWFFMSNCWLWRFWVPFFGEHWPS